MELTILSGIAVFILSQYVKEYIINPELEFKRTLGRIDNKLKFYSNIITNPGDILPREIINECSHELRNLSCDLEVNYKQLIYIKHGMESNKLIASASTALIFLSNNIYKNGEGVRNSDKIDEIRKCLNLPQII